MPTVRIGRRNSAFQVLHSLRSSRQKRHQSRTFLVEGVRPISAAVEHGWALGAVLYAAGARLSSWARDVIARAAAPIHYELSRELIAELSRKDEPSELLVLARMPADDPGRIAVTPHLVAAVVDRPASPGNLGTLIRSCDAFGVHGVIVAGHAADVYDPATITASRGSLFAVPVIRVPSPAAVADWISEVRRHVPALEVFGADEQGALAIHDADLRGPRVIVFGNEARGLSRAFTELCDSAVRIPMVGSASSLNLGVAGSVVFYEIARQRQQATRA